MFAYLLFLKKDNEDICKNIYAEDEGQLFNYTLDEDYSQTKTRLKKEKRKKANPS